MRVGGIALLLVFAACQGSAEPVRATLPGGALSFDLLTQARDDGDATRHRWHLNNGLVVATQIIAKSDGFARDRDIDAVAGALTTQYQLGDVQGLTVFAPCRVATHDARCASGTVTSDGASFRRDSLLFERSSDFVLFDVTGLPSQDPEIERQVRLARATLSVTAGTAGGT